MADPALTAFEQRRAVNAATKPEPVLSFNETEHWYFVDAVRVPSVTQVLELSGLVDYSFIPPATRNMALKRGSMVHQATAWDDEGDLDESSLDPALVGYVEGWRKFRADTGFTPDQIEHRGFHPRYMYAGTKDRRGTFTGKSSKYDLDIKCGKAQPWVWLQLAAYQAMEPDPRTKLPYCVELPGDGTWREYPRPADWSFDLYFNYFLNCLAVSRLQVMCGARKG